MIVTAGQTCASAVAEAGLPTTGPKAIVVVRDPSGQLRDLDCVFDTDTSVEPVAIDSPDGLKVLRHSTAALGMTAPEGSLTVPVSSAVDCAAAPMANTASITNEVNRRYIPVPLPLA